MAPKSFVFPDDSKRVTVIGRSGSGKTQSAVWLLSKRSYTSKPWIIFDFKREKLLNQIPFAEEITLKEKLPRYPGVYLVHPLPGQERDIEAMLWRIHGRERIGLFVDEGYMLAKGSAAFEAVLTQGRSKEIPVIMLIQRPVKVSRFALSEAEYIQMFELTDRRDKRTVTEFMPEDLVEHELPGAYYSAWWDNPQKYKAILQPVPNSNTILNTFYDRLRQPKRVM